MMKTTFQPFLHGLQKNPHHIRVIKCNVHNNRIHSRLPLKNISRLNFNQVWYNWQICSKVSWVPNGLSDNKPAGTTAC